MTETAATHHTLTLKPDLNQSISIHDGSRKLDFDFTACFDDSMHAYIVNRGDTFNVVVEVTGPVDLPDGLRVCCLNLLSCPAPIGIGQIFHTAFRQNPDFPDEQILTSGTAKFLPRFQEPPTNKLVFDMTQPEFVPFHRAGDFAIMFRLALARGTGENTKFFTFAEDPEVCVKGSFP